MSRFRFVGVTLLAAMAAACGDGPTEPQSGPSILCPGDVRVDSTDGGTVPVTFSLPPATGGRPPYKVVCAPSSGTQLAPGTHTINCIATDSAGRDGQCSFHVSVIGPPVLTETRFLAFGDSITEGQVDDATTSRPRIVDLSAAYPTRLQAMLRQRYRTQLPTVTNAGCGGEAASVISGTCADGDLRGGGLRLPGVIARTGAEVLLLMEGTNDVTSSNSARNARALDVLGQMVSYARGQGLRVFLATIPPVIPGGSRNFTQSTVAEIEAFNVDIRSLAVVGGAVLVDVHAALKDRPELMAPDQLHPTRAGMQVIADTFFAAIRRTLEREADALPQSAGLTLITQGYVERRPDGPASRP